MIGELAGKVAVITGAASGIGFAMAQRFAEEGVRVVLANIEGESLALSCSELMDKGHEVASFRLDVSRPEDVKGLADFAFERYGSVQILCNNAGWAWAARSGSTALMTGRGYWVLMSSEW